MEKEEELSPLLASIRNDVRIAGPTMREFSMHVIDQEISRYPLYIAYQDEISFGRPFIKKEAMQLNWNYNVSLLEEFVKRGAILPDKVEEFKDTYGDPEERACIFVVLPNEGGFVFMPFGTEGDEENFLLPSLN